MVLRRMTMARCFGLAWAIVLGVSAIAAASPRNTSESGGSTAAGSASLHRQSVESWRYRTVGENTHHVAPKKASNRSKAFYRSGEHSVAQISPMILRGGERSLEDDGPECATKSGRRSSCYRTNPVRPKDLVDALLEAPSPATEKILKDIGIPAINDVPPIAILRAGHPDANSNFTAELR